MAGLGENSLAGSSRVPPARLESYFFELRAEQRRCQGTAGIVKQSPADAIDEIVHLRSPQRADPPCDGGKLRIRLPRKGMYRHPAQNAVKIA